MIWDKELDLVNAFDNETKEGWDDTKSLWQEAKKLENSWKTKTNEILDNKSLVNLKTNAGNEVIVWDEKETINGFFADLNLQLARLSELEKKIT